MEYVPDYYRSFRCTADRCTHTCCAGWEIDVDADSAARFRALPEPWAGRMRTALAADADGAHFVLTDGERCPFLDPDGLCALIKAFGDGVLCDICAEHPRWHNEIAGRTETGLGLCCEAAAELILTRQQKTVLIPLTGNAAAGSTETYAAETSACEDEDDDPASEAEAEAEQALLVLRDEVIALLQDRSLPMCERLAHVCARAGIPPETDIPAFARFLLTLERMDEEWTALLSCIGQADAGTPISCAGTSLSPCPGAQTETALEQLAVCFAYRHIAGAVRDGAVQERIALCVRLTQLLQYLTAAAGRPLAELARICSCELEYSDENIELILDYLS